MTTTRLKKFLDYIETKELMPADKLRRVVHQYTSFDLRFGHLASVLGYIQPEHINSILLEQSRTGQMFGQCAVKLNLMTGQQVERLISLQRDDLAIFSQAVGIQKAATSAELTSYIKDFVREHPEASETESPREAGGKLDENIRAVIQRVEHISPLPGSVERVLAVLDDVEVKLDEVARILKTDPGLTAMLLRVANSACYGLRSKIGSIQKAMHILGTHKLRQLVAVAGIMQKFQSVNPEEAVKFWEQSIRTAECCKVLGKYCRIAELDDLFVCGLLHNIGELLTLQYFQGQTGEIRAKVAKKIPQLDAEKEVLGGTHADLGGFLLHIWKLPKTTIQSAMFHHYDYPLLLNMPNLTEEAYIVHMAATVCGLPPNMDSFTYSRMLDVIGEKYQPRLKYPTILDVNELMAKVDTSLEHIDKNYFH